MQSPRVLIKNTGRQTDNQWFEGRARLGVA